MKISHPPRICNIFLAIQLSLSLLSTESLTLLVSFWTKFVFLFCTPLTQSSNTPLPMLICTGMLQLSFSSVWWLEEVCLLTAIFSPAFTRHNLTLWVCSVQSFLSLPSPLCLWGCFWSTYLASRDVSVYMQIEITQWPSLSSPFNHRSSWLVYKNFQLSYENKSNLETNVE